MQRANKTVTMQIAALYIRLSREDGDKTESLSVANQRLKLQEYVKKLPELSHLKTEYYIDDGYTGTNFNRPGFEKLRSDIEAGLISVVIVKDLSRLGRHMPKVTELIQEYFPSKRVRFIAIDDNIDKQFFDLDTSEEMMIDMKNMFNGFYPKDISKKVRSTFRTKQHAGQFIGAFACYGYRKDPANHNHLIIDEPAAEIVRRIFSLYLSGKGQKTIAKILNDDGILCPSEYKKMCGLNYHNSKRLEHTTYWTYSSIRNILRHRIYTGTMVQNTSFRQICNNKAIRLPKEQWIIVPNTHEAIIDQEMFDQVQELLSHHNRPSSLNQNIHIFAGLLKCGDCGRAMVKINRRGITSFTCGSYNRYGTHYCSAHNIEEAIIAEIIRNDLNVILTSIHNLQDLIEMEQKQLEKAEKGNRSEITRLENEIQKIVLKKSRAYDDYMEDLITKAEYIRYKEKCDQLTANLTKQIAILSSEAETKEPKQNTWIKRLLEIGYIEKLDRETVVEMVHRIFIYDDNRIQIIYNFSDELHHVMENFCFTAI